MTILPESNRSNSKISVGQKIGLWTVLSLAQPRLTKKGTNQTKWLCKCECGTQRNVLASNLNRGQSKSCGCTFNQKKDLAGQKFGRLTLIERIKPGKYGKSGKEQYRSKWRCQCECGQEIIADQNPITSGKQKSCGCYKKEGFHVTHGESNTRLYQTWIGMKGRCRDTDQPHNQHYGRRGIAVCQEWQDSFESFSLWAKNNGYADDLTIERIDVNGNYCPENCTFVTWARQARNKRNTVWLTAWGEAKPLADWLDDERTIEGLKESALRERIKLGWTVEAALTTPSKAKHLQPPCPR